MKQFDVYPRYKIDLDRGEGNYVFDTKGNQYLDLYGGHAVISIGHAHPHFVKRIESQLNKLSFYSNSVGLEIQEEYADSLGESSSYPDYQLFLCNSGAEANENALKLASFITGRKKIVSFEKGFHGRTSLAVEATDNAKIQAPVNITGNILRLKLNDLEAAKEAIDESVAAVIIEGIQGIAGIYLPDDSFLQGLRKICDERGALLILDEVQSGFGRAGHFFAHQYANVRPDIISMAKGMGNGFPIGGILISNRIEARAGMLGTTFGGNPLACAAGLAVLEVIKKENLLENAGKQGEYVITKLKTIQNVSEVRGRGLMIGIQLPFAAKSIRERLLMEHQIFTGSASDPNTLRILPALNIERSHLDTFLDALTYELKNETISVN